MLYSAGYTDDLRLAISHIRRCVPREPGALPVDADDVGLDGDAAGEREPSRDHADRLVNQAAEDRLVGCGSAADRAGDEDDGAVDGRAEERRITGSAEERGGGDGPLLLDSSFVDVS